MKKESYEKLEMEVIAFDKIHMDTSSTSGIAVDDREDADEGIWTGYYYNLPLDKTAYRML